MNMTNAKQAERTDAICEIIERARVKLADADDLRLPEPAIVREAVFGILNSRTGAMLANAPARAKKPLSSVLHRMLAWHSGSGYLGTALMLKWDCRDIAETRDDIDQTEFSLYDQMETLCLVLTNGRSRAADQWAGLLGWRRSDVDRHRSSTRFGY